MFSMLNINLQSNYDGKRESDLCNEEVHPGQQVDQDQTEDKQIIDLRLDRPQESIHGSQGQELPRTTEERRNRH